MFRCCQDWSTHSATNGVDLGKYNGLFDVAGLRGVLLGRFSLLRKIRLLLAVPIVVAVIGDHEVWNRVIIRICLGLSA